MDTSLVTWRKSSYSTSSGGNCVEVGVWRKASYSSSNGGNCVEVTRTPAAAVAVRDSKDPGGPKLAFSAADWREFTGRIKDGRTGLA
jgi:Domain of unknown function (DUF397)